MNKTKETCGLFIFDPEGKLLICHPTKHSDEKWTIPKGMRDNDETQWAAAVRETLEETGLDIEKHPHKKIKLPEIMYSNHNKILVSFVVFLDKAIQNDFEYKCSTFVPKKLGGYPEIDDWRWSSIELASPLLHEAQQKAILNVKL